MNECIEGIHSYGKKQLKYILLEDFIIEWMSMQCLWNFVRSALIVHKIVSLVHLLDSSATSFPNFGEVSLST